MGKQFLSVPYDILSIPDLSPTEKLLLGRIAGFEEYFESSAKCAELFCLKEDTVSKAKRHLTALGYIKEVENTGRGKKYVATQSWKKEKHPVAEPQQAQPVVANSSAPTPEQLGLKGSSNERQTTKAVKFTTKYAAYLPAYDKGLEFLRRRHIGVSNRKSLEADFSALVDTFADYPAEDVNSMLITYFEYLESGPYLYQVAKNKFCPQVLSQQDLYRKFTAIRNFKNSSDRQYDPSKVLTH